MYLVYLKAVIKIIHTCVCNKNFLNYRFFKKYPNDIKITGIFNIKIKRTFAIVMQGPLVNNDNFTIETLKLYRKNFPASILILSTWHINAEVKKTLLKNDVIWIENIKPDNHGISNINLQIVTTSAGILTAKKLGVGFVLKTRTDQRIYHPSLENYLFNLVRSFPLLSIERQQINRFVTISMGTFKNRLYCISDMFMYGHIDDMVKYWCIPLHMGNENIMENNTEESIWQELSMHLVPEVHFCTNYLKNIGCKILYTIKDSYRIISERFIIIDQSAIKLYWHKYTLDEDRYASFGLFDPEISFNDWLILYNSINLLSIDERILD